MIYQITDNGVRTGRDFKSFNDKYHIMLEEEECVRLGNDFVICVTNKDLEFLQDKARVSNIMMGNLFRKDNSGKVLILINMILTFLSIIVK